MSEQLGYSTEIPSPEHMTNALRGLLRRRNRILQSGQPNRRSYELGDFSGSDMEKELYGHVFLLAALLEDHCLTEGARPALVPVETITRLEAESADIMQNFRDFLDNQGLSVSDYNTSYRQAAPLDRRVILMDTLTAGLEEQGSYAAYVAYEGQAAMHFAFDARANDAA